MGGPLVSTQRTMTVGVLLFPDWPMLAFSSVVEPLRIANRLSAQPLYRWHLLSPDDGPVAASNGLALTPDWALERAGELDLLLVLSGIDAQRFCDAGLLRRLRRLAVSGVHVGAISIGSIILAEAGLLDGYRCTIHWENLASFQESYPRARVSPELFEIDRGRMTCSGGTAALDMTLSMIRDRHGQELAAAVAEQCLHAQIRDSSESQRMNLRTRLEITHPKVLRVVARMQGNLEDPISLAELARDADLTLRQLERLFRYLFQKTPKQYYLNLRLERARQFLRQTSLSVAAVAEASGFSSATYFSTCYRRHFGTSPNRDRIGATRSVD